jgi:hypothetical protein
MDDKKDKPDEMLYHAYRCLFFNEMLIRQSDKWLTAEEGNRNMEKSIIERRKKEKEKEMIKEIKKPQSFWRKVFKN